MKDRRLSHQKLMELAAKQGGYFTAGQALEIGYGYRLQHFHNKSENWIKEGHGIYRLNHYPMPERPDLIRLSLWSRNQQGEVQAVVSYETALAIHELSDVMPSKIYLTVPPKFRKTPPTNCILHKKKLHSKDWISCEGYRLMTPLRTLLDVAEGDLSQEHLNQAVAQAFTRGMVREKNLRQADLESQGKIRLDVAIKTRKVAA